MYRRPAVTVIQEFTGLVPALAQFSLPTVVVGPAYQLVSDDMLGSYSAALQVYAYASVMAGAVVDAEPAVAGEMFPATKKPVSVKFTKAEIMVLELAATGDGSDVNFSDVTVDQFAGIVAGDILVVVGGANDGRYVVRSKTDANNLVLQSPLPSALTGMSYKIHRAVSEIVLQPSQFTADSAAVTLGASIDVVIGAASFQIMSGTVKASYRALRNDLSGSVVEYSRLSDVQAQFGVDQITPANPLAFGLSMMLQNTTTPVNGLGLDGAAVSNEVLSFQNAADVLALTEMYAIVPLSQNPVVAQLFKSHVEGLSQPDAKKERVAIVNRLLISSETMMPASTLVSTVAGSRIIVNTQTDGAGALANPAVLNDATVDQFMNVQLGDMVVVTGGTNAVVGDYPVASKASSNQLTVTGSIFTGACTDLAYYIVRQDGLGADGQTFYDRNAAFLSSLVVAGMTLEIMAGPLLGSYKIASVSSDKQLMLAQVPGVTSLKAGLEYRITRVMTKTEQANVMKGYSASLGSRRVVNVWPDVLQAPVGQTIYDVPGFYGACAIGAMTSGLPTQQGFTNLSVSGFLGLKHSTGYFDDAQLDIIADGGTLIFAQAGDQQPLYVRHQLTTDRSAIKFQEYSITKNVDFIAKFLRQTYAPFIGKYNIVETTMDELRGTAKAAITFLKEDTRLPRIGGVIRSGQLTVLEQHPTQIDTVRMRFKLDIPVPLNNLDITIEV
jgi:hypothetical protein